MKDSKEKPTKEPDYPLAVALEKAGYAILKLEGTVENVYDSSKKKTIPQPVVNLKVMPNNGAKGYFTN